MGKRHGIVPAVITLAVLLASRLCAFALDPALDISQYAHTAWKIREGFTKGTIGSIAQTPDGYLWLATEFGLLRFDGVRNVPWEPPPDQPLPSNSISSLLVAHDGALWIGTSKGLASWKDGKLTRYPQLDGFYVVSLLEDHEGTIWAGTLGFPNGRLCSINNHSIHCDGEDGSLGTLISGLYEDRKGNLWVGGKIGLWRWKPGAVQFFSLPSEIGDIRAIGEDDDGTIIVGWRDRIVRLVDGKTEAYRPLSGAHNFSALKMLRDRDGALWIATKVGLFHVHRGKTDVFAHPDGLSADWAASLFEDREGNIWVPTVYGLDRFREFSVSTLTTRQGLSSDAVMSVLAAKDGSIWFVADGNLSRSDNGQITVFGERGMGSVKAGEKTNRESPLSIFQDSKGQVWVSTIAGFGYLSNDRIVPVTHMPGGFVRSIIEDTAGTLWIANKDRGLLHLVHGNEVTQIPWTALGHKDFASALAADPLGGLWIGFFDGGVSYFKDGQIRSYSAGDGLGEGWVSDIRVDNEGSVWAATGTGLSRLKNGYVATLNSKNGLPCDAVNWAIEDDDHSFWLNTPCGLIRVARSELDALASAVERAASHNGLGNKETPPNVTLHTTVFDSSDGVRSLANFQGLSPVVAKTSDGKLWFLPMDGISVVNPRHLPINKLPPPVHVEQVIADRKTYEASSNANGKLRLPPRIRDLQIDYTALSLVAPEKVLFRYKLEGWDHDWQDVGTRRQAFYTNLPPRNYRFRVMACNNSGVWNEAGTFLDFSIAPAYYQTWWFRSLCGVAFLAMVYGAYRLRVGQLRAQEERFRETIESIPAMAFVSLPDGYRTFVNKGWVEYTGITLEQSLGSGWHAAIHPEDLKRVLGEWQAALASGKPMYYEARYRRAEDGQYRWFMVRVVPQRNKRGKIGKWFGTLTDVEDRKRAEESLRSSEAYLVEAQSLTQTGSCAIDGRSHETMYWSEEMFRLFDFDPQQGLPTFDQWLQRVHPEDREKLKLASERTFVNKVNCDVEFRVVKPDGTVKHIHGIGHPVLSPTGELVQVLGTMVDVTERKLAEGAREKLRQLEADLAHTNRVSTLGEMAASLAHEIKQPIAATITSANSCMEWLAHEPPNLDRARAAAARIDKYGNRAAEIIDRIRSFYKKSAPHRQLVDVNGIIQEMLTLLKCEADQYSIAMRAELAAELPKIMVDRVQLQQVFMNLMLNAIEAMKDAGGDLTVKSQADVDGQLLFSVSDTGVGLPTEKMDQIFSAFFTTKPMGSGMGLAITRSIVESHGGRLWAAANDGRGATFHFTLPTAAEILQLPATGT
jgi:PAS domain S-box-containing protein